MQSTQWETVNRIFEEALLLPEHERFAFVHAASAGNDDLCRRVDALLQADSDAGSFLDRPAISLNQCLTVEAASPALTPGSLLAGRFEILRFLSEGGMGSVYEAFDLELHTSVALKLIRPEIAAYPQSLDRFRREVALARRITHPGVCRTFDFERTLHEDRELLFLTMEMLLGETLRERLANVGSLSSSEAMAIGSQVAEALDAAHTLGVIHRDIKPGNIMLVPAEHGAGSLRAVIMDFGLARCQARETVSVDHSITQFTDLTQAGLPLGTLAYMAPEQIEGLAASSATDSYALALVFIEALSGRRVFSSDDPLSGLAQRLRGSIPIETLLPADVPPDWLLLLRRALSPNPEERPNTPLALMEGLRHAIASPGFVMAPRYLKARAIREHIRTIASVISRRRFLQAAFCTTVFAVVSLLGWKARLLGIESNSAVTQGSTVYLAPLTNGTGLRSLNEAGVLLDANLQQSAHVRLVDRARVAQTLATMTKPADTSIDATTAREIAMRAGAVRVVFPSIRRSGGKLTLDIVIEQPDQSPARARARWCRSFPWTPKSPAENTETQALDPDMFAAVRLAGDWVRARTGESANDIARLDIPPEDATTANWEALEEYALAEKEFAAGKRSEGITALQRATSLDSQFALAYGRLGDVLTSVGQWEQGLAAYRSAISTTNRQRLTRRELDRVRGLYAIDTHDYVVAEAQFRDLTSFYPDDWLGWFYRADPLLRTGNAVEAIECLKRALVLHPQQRIPTYNLGLYTLIAGDMAQARSRANALEQGGFRQDAAWLNAQVAFAEATPDVAEQQLQQMKEGTTEHMFWGYLLLSHLAAERGQSQTAIGILQEALRSPALAGDDTSRATFLMQRAALLCRLRDWESCIADIRASLALDSAPEQKLFASMVFGDAVPEVPKGAAAQMHAILRAMIQSLDARQVGPLFDKTKLQMNAELSMLAHRCGPALRDLDEEDHLDEPAGSREYLARALETCAQWEPDPHRAADLRSQAAAAYARGAFQPAFDWFEAHIHEPDHVSWQLRQWLILANPTDSRYRFAQQRMQRMSGTQFLNAPSSVR